jgi:hypothetical protein
MVVSNYFIRKWGEFTYRYKNVLRGLYNLNPTTIMQSGLGAQYNILYNYQSDLTSDTYTFTPSFAGMSSEPVDSSVTTSSGTITKMYTPSLYADDHTEENLSPGITYEIPFIWTWNLAAYQTSLDFSLVIIDLGITPGWVNLNIAEQKITIGPTPVVGSPTLFGIGLKSAFAGSHVVKKFLITVIPWVVSNWLRCSPSDDTICTEWLSDYTLGIAGKTWNNPSNSPNKETEEDSGDETTTQETITQGIIAVGVFVSLGAALASMSSPQSAFSMINQFQLYILLPMIGVYMPSKVVTYITGMSFTMFSFSFIPFEKIPLSSSIFDFFDYTQNEDYYDSIGLQSKSCLLNHLPLLAMMTVVGIMHLSYLPWYKASKHLQEGSWMRWACGKLFRLLTFTIYIRMILEAYLFMSISVMAELKEYSYENITTLVSLISAHVYAAILAGFWTLWVWEIFKRIRIDNDKIYYFSEFFSGVKHLKKARLYALNFMVVRILFVAIVVGWSDLTNIIKLVLFSLTQTWFVAYMIIVRPFNSLKDNIIEIWNQILYLILVWSLFYLDSSSRWISTVTTTYIWTLMSGPIFCTLVSLAFLVKSIAKRVKNCRKGKAVVDKLKASNVTSLHIISSKPPESKAAINKSRPFGTVKEAEISIREEVCVTSSVK